MYLFSLGKIFSIYICTVAFILKIKSQLANPISANGTQPQLPLTYYFNVTLDYSQISIVFNYTNYADVDWYLTYASSGAAACNSTNPANYFQSRNCSLNTGAYKLSISTFSGNCGNWILVVGSISTCGLANCHYCPSGTSCQK